MREWKHRHDFAGVENAGVEKSARSKMQGWKRREWKHRHDFAGVENAGVEKSARFCRGGKCRSGKIGTILQGWKMQEWKNRHDFAGMENAGVEPSGKIDTAECYAGVCREKNG